MKVQKLKLNNITKIFLVYLNVIIFTCPINVLSNFLVQNGIVSEHYFISLIQKNTNQASLKILFLAFEYKVR